jgi:predicted Na+-dependent transporter
MNPGSDGSGASWAARLERAFVPLTALAGIVGLLLPAPLRTAVDHSAINVVLAFLVLTSAASVPTGTRQRLRANAGRLAVVLALSTVALGFSAWAVSHLVSDRELAHGVLALGVAPTEIATIALTALAGGAVAVTAALLTTSTVISVLIAGPVLAIEAGGNVNATKVLVDLVVIVAVPMLLGLASRRFVTRSERLGGSLEPLSMLAVVVLVALVASQVHFTSDYATVLVALIVFIAASTVAGAAISRLAPADVGVAVLLSTSIRDFAIASGIATSAFGAASAGPLGLYGVLVIGWGAVLARAQRRRSRRP